MTIETYKEAARLYMAINRHSDFIEAHEDELTRLDKDSEKAATVRGMIEAQKKIVSDLEKQFSQL